MGEDHPLTEIFQTAHQLFITRADALILSRISKGKHPYVYAVVCPSLLFQRRRSEHAGWSADWDGHQSNVNGHSHRNRP
jgi:hypothetical protein